MTQQTHKIIAQKLNEKVSKTRKFSLTRMDYISSVPADAEVVAYLDLAIVAYKYESPQGGPAIMAFQGKSNKPVRRFRFSTTEQRDNCLAELVEAVTIRKERNEENKKRQTQPTTLEVGDILDSSWGYEQTNVDFYQVTEVVGKRTVKIRKISYKMVEDSMISHGMACNVVPVKDSFIGEEETKMVTNGHMISFNSFRSASKWNGRPCYNSWYG